jgi:hypothetical protein
MSQFENVFMAGFFDALGEEKTAGEEMSVLDKALTNLGLLEAGEEEEVEMPILKQALENLGLTEEEEEPASMLEALAQRHGPAVIAEREALEKEAKLAAGARGLLSGYAGRMKEFGRGAKRLAKSYRPKKGKPGKRTPRPKGRALQMMREKAKKELKKGGPAAAGTALVGTGGIAAALAARRKKKKGKK